MNTELENKQNASEEKSDTSYQVSERYNTYNERKGMNVVPFFISVISIIVLCCMPFEIHYGEPECYIAFDNGKLMLAILLTMAFFYFLGFDMVAFCVASVNLAYLAINTYDLFIYYRSELLSGFYMLWACAVLIAITHFLYPWVRTKISKRDRD